jgi:hypothetical protein
MKTITTPLDGRICLSEPERADIIHCEGNITRNLVVPISPMSDKI